MSAPVWHYARDGWSTACGRRVINVAVATSVLAEATCRACLKSAEMMGEM